MSLIVWLIIITALVFGIYYLFFAGKLTTADPTKATAGNTEYLRPNKWRSIPLGIGIETYSDLGEGKQATASVTVSESSTSIRYSGNDKPASWYDEIRQQAIANERVDYMKAFFLNGGKNCTSNISFDVKPDTKTSNSTIGMTLATGTCVREDGTYIVKRRTAVGEDDGIFRHIAIGASESDWIKNQAVYEVILNSIGQVNS